MTGRTLTSNIAGSFTERLRCSVCSTINLISHLKKKKAKSGTTHEDRCARCGTGLRNQGSTSKRAA